MPTTLIIARHGNTFTRSQTPKRVGLHTDLPLVDSGIEQARLLGRYLKENKLIPNRIFTSQLCRTQQTAQKIIEVLNLAIEPIVETMFNEIDYGPDENKSEADVVSRIGQEALEAWDQLAIPPAGWKLNPAEMIENWLAFGKVCARDFENDVILVVTSNGVARFAPYLTGNFAAFNKEHDIKISTGALCVLQKEDKQWEILAWNIKPKNTL